MRVTRFGSGAPTPAALLLRVVVTVVTALFAVVGLVVTGPVGGVQRSAAAAAAPRVTGVEVVRVFAATNSRSPKEATAQCPPGKQVIGGGATIGGTPPDEERVTLTQVEPFRDGAGRYNYAARAAETAPGTSLGWNLGVQAICADPVAGYQIKVGTIPASSAAVQDAEVHCGDGKRALGSGARINFPIDVGPDGRPFDDPHGIGLQIARDGGQGGLTRAQAHEQPAGFGRNWSVFAFAVCADTPSGYEVSGAISPERASEPIKRARATCPGRKQQLGMGAAVSNVAPGNVTLYTIFTPVDASDRPVGGVTSVAVENTPTLVNWDFIVAHVICVD